MDTAPARPTLAAGWRLPVARALAWALLLAGWLVLGTLGRRHWPLLAGGQGALALWLLAVGLGLAWARQRPAFTGRRLRQVLLASVALLVAALLLLQAGGARFALAGAAIAWAVFLVAASCTVKALREAATVTPPAPLRPALAGAALASLATWGLLQDAASQVSSVLLLALAAAGAWLAWAVPVQRTDLRACRSGLFDCAWPVPGAAAWRQAVAQPWQLPRLAALLGMLPMMVGLAPMTEACAGEWGLPLPASATLHLVAMLLPATLARRWLARTHPRVLAGVLTGWLGLAAVLAMALPGLAAAMVASLLQALAWSLAWAAPMLTRHVQGAAPRRPASPRALAIGQVGVAALTAAVVLVLGLTTGLAGPASAAWVAVALAMLAAGAWVVPSRALPRGPSHADPGP